MNPTDRLSVTKNVTALNMTGKAVINMSLGGPASRAVNSAVTAANRAGITVVAAAGNDAVCITYSRS